MDQQQVGKIAEAAFQARFGDVEIVWVNVRSDFDHGDDPGVDVNIIYDGNYEQLKAMVCSTCVGRSSTRFGAMRKTPPVSRWSTSSPSRRSGGATRPRCTPGRHRLVDARAI